MDCRAFMRSLPEKSVNCGVTSPPYYGLRNYGVDGQIGLELTPEEFVEALVETFREMKRVLRDDGTLWLNLGDSYASSGKGGNPIDSDHTKQRTKIGSLSSSPIKVKTMKPKDLIGIPWMVAFALRADGWYLRQDIIWHKPNPMPESVTDRCTKSHEYIFLLSKSEKYYFDQDAIRTPLKDESIARLAQEIADQNGSDRVPGKTNGNMKAVVKGYPIGGSGKYQNGDQMHRTKMGKDWAPVMAGSGGINNCGRSGYHDGNLMVGATANKKSVWTVTTKPFKEAHFATFPPDLIEPCILAGCPVGGIVLDPFMGSGTTAEVALRAQRKFIGSELNPEYIKIAMKRLAPLLNQHEMFV